MTTLVERWSDYTLTFHFQFREMTIKSLDYTTIIGFTFAGQWIPFDIPKDPMGFAMICWVVLLSSKLGGVV